MGVFVLDLTPLKSWAMMVIKNSQQITKKSASILWYSERKQEKAAGGPLRRFENKNGERKEKWVVFLRC